jgi:hypothetical protein
VDHRRSGGRHRSSVNAPGHALGPSIRPIADRVRPATVPVFCGNIERNGFVMAVTAPIG